MQQHLDHGRRVGVGAGDLAEGHGCEQQLGRGAGVVGAELAGGDPGGEVVGQQLPSLSHQGVQAGADGGVGAAGGEEQADQLGVLGQDGLDQGVLVVEVVVEEALGDPGGGGDVLDGGAVDALVDEGGQGGIQQPLAPPRYGRFRKSS